jgi:DNA-binding response OmpR family regulator
MKPQGLSVLVVEDNDDLRETLLGLIADCGFQALGVPAAEDVDDNPGTMADIYIVDLNLPGEDGISLARRLRAAQPEAAIIMTTVRTGLDQRIAGYGSGADIYLPKPVAPVELIACLEALARRLMVRRPATLVLTITTHQLSGYGACVLLQPGESNALAALARAPQRTLERWQLEQLFGIDVEGPSRAVLDVRISRLRRKLQDVGADANILKAIPGLGYQLRQHIDLV